MSPATTVLVDLVVAFGLVVVLPLGLSLLGPRTVPGAGGVWWPVAGAVTAAGAWLPRGSLAQAATVPFLVASAVLVGAAVRVALPGPTAPRPPEVRLAVGVALVMPGVGAAAMLADRGGWGLLGFSGTYLTLTVPHMLFAGFAAALVAGLTVGLGHRSAGAGGAVRATAARTGAAGVPLGTGLVLVGYFVGNVAELVGALVLTGALWCTAWAVLGIPARRGARALLVAGSGAVAASMLLAVWWAVGEATGVPHPSIGQMAATHGVANALGFALCTMLGLRLARVGAGSAGVAPVLQEDDRSAHRPSRSPGRRQA
ncbi:YndJ family transporter [Oerskovia sp. NPDC057915]|uniref:YndJ family transporter n=1 Tax=Oerskovia sp. NPDC057915 TaxID=3346280 RepID=UPI0036DF4B10